jgi:phosphatidate cytidylyltransferase
MIKQTFSTLKGFSNLTQRIIAAVIGVLIIIPAVIYHEWTYFGVFLIICTMTQWEFYRVVGLDGYLPLKTWGTLTGIVTFSLTFLIQRGTLTEFWYFLLLPFFYGVFFIKLYRNDSLKPFTSIAFTLLGVIYVAFPFSLLNFTAFTFKYYDYPLVLGPLFILWASDIGAYFAGSRFGRRKLFERVSPKKTWEGLLGGFVLAALVAFGLSHFFTDLNLFQWLMLAAILVITGTYGDLIESMFKRSMEIKDSGEAIPGHGGFLDRFDALLIASPFITAFLRLTI